MCSRAPLLDTTWYVARRPAVSTRNISNGAHTPKRNHTMQAQLLDTTWYVTWSFLPARSIFFGVFNTMREVFGKANAHTRMQYKSPRRFGYSLSINFDVLENTLRCSAMSVWAGAA